MPVCQFYIQTLSLPSPYFLPTFSLLAPVRTKASLAGWLDIGGWRGLLFLEVALVHRAEGAHPVGGQVFELGARGDAVVGIAFCRVILVPADVANILFHNGYCFKVNISTAKVLLFSYMAKNILRKTLPMSSERPAGSFLHSFFMDSMCLLCSHIKYTGNHLYPNMPKYL